jgi:hypothetical protein
MRTNHRTVEQEEARWGWLSTSVAAQRIGGEPPVSTEHIVGLIEDGELRARDVSRKGSKRPEYRVDPASLEEFLDRRADIPGILAARRKAA